MVVQSKGAKVLIIMGNRAKVLTGKKSVIESVDQLLDISALFSWFNDYTLFIRQVMYRG